MGLNFDDYPGFQPKITPAQRYSTQYIPKRSVFRDIDWKTILLCAQWTHYVVFERL